jgi:hypothetical protein
MHTNRHLVPAGAPTSPKTPKVIDLPSLSQMSHQVRMHMLQTWLTTMRVTCHVNPTTWSCVWMREVGMTWRQTAWMAVQIPHPRHDSRYDGIPSLCCHTGESAFEVLLKTLPVAIRPIILISILSVRYLDRLRTVLRERPGLLG